MGRIGVQMIHRPCGHGGYHLVEQGKNNRKLYDKIAEKPCPACLGETTEEVQPTPKLQIKALLDEVEDLVMGKTKIIPQYRQVQIRRGR